MILILLWSALETLSHDHADTLIEFDVECQLCIHGMNSADSAPASASPLRRPLNSMAAQGRLNAPLIASHPRYISPRAPPFS